MNNFYKYSVIFVSLGFNTSFANEPNYGVFQNFLDKYSYRDGENVLINYDKVNNNDLHGMQKLVSSLEKVDLNLLGRNEKKAYWINVYNIVTINLILEDKPKKSIKEIKSGFFSFGPWDLKLFNNLSLNDIEHEILRKKYKDYRIHYALNCASIGCPNISRTVFNSNNIDGLLSSQASEFVNSDKGVKNINQNEYKLSKIYKWFQEDFGNNEQEVVSNINKYRNIKIDYNKDIEISYSYDWNLNKI